MNRVFQIVEYGEKVPLQFSSKAESTEGVFRSFAKKHFGLLKEGTVYILYANVDFGFKKFGSAFWNGKAFVKVSYKALDGNFYIKEGSDYVMQRIH